MLNPWKKVEWSLLGSCGGGVWEEGDVGQRDKLPDEYILRSNTQHDYFS